MLADDEVDALIICSPDHVHEEQLALGITAGKHVLAEKPLADAHSQLVSVVRSLQEAQDQGLVVSSCHPRRFDPPFTYLRSALPRLRAQLGEALDIRFDFFYHQPSKTGLHKGLLLDHISHEIDLVNWLFGYSTITAHKLYDSVTRYGAAGSREDGLCFTFFGSRDLDRRMYTEFARVRFQRGEVEVNTENGIATIHDIESGEVSHEVCGPTDYERRFFAINQDFVSAIINETSPYLSPSDLIINTEIGIALSEDGFYDSASSLVLRAVQ
jgi:predicted dehydrogenase